MLLPGTKAVFQLLIYPSFPFSIFYNDLHFDLVPPKVGARWQDRTGQSDSLASDEPCLLCFSNPPVRQSCVLSSDYIPTCSTANRSLILQFIWSGALFFFNDNLTLCNPFSKHCIYGLVLQIFYWILITILGS